MLAKERGTQIRNAEENSFADQEAAPFLARRQIHFLGVTSLKRTFLSRTLRPGTQTAAIEQTPPASCPTLSQLPCSYLLTSSSLQPQEVNSSLILILESEKEISQLSGGKLKLFHCPPPPCHFVKSTNRKQVAEERFSPGRLATVCGFCLLHCHSDTPGFESFLCHLMAI